MKQPCIHPLTIGSVTLGGNLFLAPMAGYTDVPFRSLCVEHGADLTYTEMVSAEGLYRDSAKTEELMVRSPEEKQYVIQLFMGETAPVAKAVEKVNAYHPLLIDINAGCPVPKVTRTGSGSALMKDPEKIRAIVAEVRTHTDIPVSVKFRLGWDQDHINFLEFADAAVQGGASVLTLHTRTRTEGYAPYAHKERLGELIAWRNAHAPGVLLVASGDLFTKEDVVDTLRSWPVDAVMVARGAIGNPFIFEDAKALSRGEEPLPLTIERRTEALMAHVDKEIAVFGERVGCRQMRKCASFYLKGLRGVSQAKASFNSAETRDDYRKICDLLSLPG